MELAFFALCIAFLAGLWRLGFSAGLAWFLVTGVLAAVFWPLALFIALAVSAYGFGGLIGRATPPVTNGPASR